MIWSILWTRFQAVDRVRRCCCPSRTNSEKDVGVESCPYRPSRGWMKIRAVECWPRGHPDLPNGPRCCWGHRYVVAAAGDADLQGSGQKIQKGGCWDCTFLPSVAPDLPWSSLKVNLLCYWMKDRQSDRRRWLDPIRSNRWGSLYSNLK